MNNPRNPNYNKFILPDGYKDIGWQMNVGNPVYKNCIESNHKRREFDNSMFKHRCTDVVTICDECKVVWHTDMSD